MAFLSIGCLILRWEDLGDFKQSNNFKRTVLAAVVRKQT